MLRVIGAPTDLSGCVLWLDASDLSSITKDGSNKVSQWSDKSGNAKHAAQATAGDQPTYSATGFGGFPCIDWGNGEVPSRRLVTPNVLYGLHTAFVVGSAIVGTTGYVYVHNVYTSTDSEYLIHGVGVARPQLLTTRGNTTNTRDCDGGLGSDANRHILTKSFGGFNFNHNLRVDGGQPDIVNRSNLQPGTAAVNGPIYVGNANLAVAPHKGKTAELIIFDRLLSEGEIALVERYLSRKWKVALQMSRLISSPLEIPDCAMWFDAAQGVTSDVNGVSQWDDQSGNARHIGQSSNPLKPALNASNALFGGKPTIDWLSAGTGTRLDALAAVAHAHPLTVFACARASNTSATGITLFDNVSGSEISFERTAGGNVNIFSGASNAAPSTLGTAPFVLTIVFNTIDSFARVRGETVIGHKNFGTNGFTQFRMGAFINGFTTTNWNGSVAEFLVYKRRLADGEIAAVEAYLRRKYAL